MEYKGEKMEKKIKGSKRGLTFSFISENGTFAPGSRYWYVIDKDAGRIMILPSKDGGNTVSRKRSGLRIKSLIDLRSRDILELVSVSDHMEIEFREECILVAIYQKAESGRQAEIRYMNLMPELLMAAGNEDAAINHICGHMPQTGPWEDPVLRKQVPDVLRVISLFSGAGMLDHEFAKDPRFEIVYAAEYDHDAVSTYRRNIGMQITECDIRTLSGQDLPKADIIIGGPPCQPFSNANRHEDSRGCLHPEGDMFAHYLRLVRESGVRAFLIENVPGLLSAAMGHYMNLIQTILPDYSVSAKVITDCDLGGYTKRKRAVLIGNKGAAPVIPDVKMRPVRTAGEALSRVAPDWPNFSDVTVSSEWVRKKISMIPEGGNWHDLPEKYWTKSVHSNMYRRVDRNRPSISIANWRKFLLSPPKWTDSAEWDRILTVSEAAALQGLDKHFAFSGSLNSMQQQVANGVTAAIARFCKNILAGLFGRPAVMAD